MKRLIHHNDILLCCKTLIIDDDTVKRLRRLRFDYTDDKRDCNRIVRLMTTNAPDAKIVDAIADIDTDPREMILDAIFEHADYTKHDGTAPALNVQHRTTPYDK